jgi:hypothetical protein
MFRCLEPFSIKTSFEPNRPREIENRSAQPVPYTESPKPSAPLTAGLVGDPASFLLSGVVLQPSRVAAGAPAATTGTSRSEATGGRRRGEGLTGVSFLASRRGNGGDRAGA